MATPAQAIPDQLLDIYVARYPHLIHMAQVVRAGNKAAVRGFARHACRLEIPVSVSMQEIWLLAGVAEGTP